MRFLQSGRCATAFLVVALVAQTRLNAQTTLTGNSLVLRSNGTATLNGSDFVGTYITVADSGNGGSNVNFTVNAAKGAGSGADPQMHLVVADSNFGFTVGNAANTDYSNSSWLPAGTYVVRLERSYGDPTSPSASSRTASVNSLTVSGATFSNATT